MKQQIRFLKRARNEVAQDLLSAGVGTFDASVLPQVLAQINYRIENKEKTEKCNKTYSSYHLLNHGYLLSLN